MQEGLSYWQKIASNNLELAVQRNMRQRIVANNKFYMASSRVEMQTLPASKNQCLIKKQSLSRNKPYKILFRKDDIEKLIKFHPSQKN